MKARKIIRPHIGFTLVEVVLAIAVMSLAVVALLGLLVPTLSSVRNVIDTSQATAAMSKFNAHIDNEVDFDTLLLAVNNDPANRQSYFVYEILRDINTGTTEIKVVPTTEIKVVPGTSVSQVNSDYSDQQIVGPIFRFVLNRSSIWNSADYNSPNIDEQAYFPIFIQVLLAEHDGTGFSTSVEESAIERFKILSYTTAKLR